MNLFYLIEISQLKFKLDHISYQKEVKSKTANFTLMA
jgi:hypothetical protein